MSNREKIFRITTTPISLRLLLKGQLTFINKHLDVLAISSFGEDLELVKKQGIKTKAVEMTRTISPIKDVVAIIKMFLILKKEKPFIVHTHTPKAGLVGMLAAKFACVPNKLHTVAGLPLMESVGIKHSILILVEKIIYKLAD
ncbi:MAG: glycosyltransferase family 4 protein, partial [Arcobacter sp.]|nr:glycosyltransferase family 4 protein [Arcobacter sp.]